MDRFFTKNYMKCNGCQYVGRFLVQSNINDNDWDRDFIKMMLEKSDYQCPKCFETTTKGAQVQHNEVTQMAMITQDVKGCFSEIFNEGER